MSLTLTELDRLVLLQTAREAIAARLARRAPVYPPAGDSLREPRGAFVTLKTHGELRGCIGHITSSEPLADTVKEVAQASAFEDPRFPPLGPEEWDAVRIEISVLSPFEPITDASIIQVGVHGIMIRRGSRSGLLLPQVATEQGWDRETFLTHCCYKAGLPGDAWRSPDTRLSIFSAIVFHEARG
jgi:AmmeMemoRadiSam system protein A